MRKTKFDCVEMKRRGAEIVEKKTEKMTQEEEYKFWIEQTRTLKQLQKVKRQRNKQNKVSYATI